MSSEIIFNSEHSPYDHYDWYILLISSTFALTRSEVDIVCAFNDDI